MILYDLWVGNLMISRACTHPATVASLVFVNKANMCASCLSMFINKAYLLVSGLLVFTSKTYVRTYKPAIY